MGEEINKKNRNKKIDSLEISEYKEIPDFISPLLDEEKKNDKEEFMSFDNSLKNKRIKYDEKSNLISEDDILRLPVDTLAIPRIGNDEDFDLDDLFAEDEEKMKGESPNKEEINEISISEFFDKDSKFETEKSFFLKKNYNIQPEIQKNSSKKFNIETKNIKSNSKNEKISRSSSAKSEKCTAIENFDSSQTCDNIINTDKKIDPSNRIFDTDDDNEKLASKTTINNTKNVHQIEIAKNQVTNAVFELFCEKIFAEIDHEILHFIGKKSEPCIENINTKKTECFKEISLRERIISALIDEKECEELSDADKEIKLRKVKDRDKFDSEKTFLNDKFLLSFFDENNPKSVEIEKNPDTVVQLLNLQIEINNRRRSELLDIIHKRMIFRAYLRAIKIIDGEILKLYTKRIKNKRKIKSDDYNFELKEMVSKRKILEDSFLRDFSKYEEILYDVSSIFSKENVNSSNFEYEPKNYFL